MSRCMQLSQTYLFFRSIFGIPFLLGKKGSSGPVTHWRQLVSCNGFWHCQLRESHFREIQSNNKSLYENVVTRI